MKKPRQILEQMSFSAALSSEVLPGLTLIELTGYQRVLIENHHGVVAYSCSEIQIKAGYGCICVCGSGLKLARMTKEQLVITGQIDGVNIHRGRK